MSVVEERHTAEPTDGEIEALIEEARRRARRRRLGYAAVAGALLVVAASALMIGGEGDSGTTRPDGPSPATDSDRPDILFMRAIFDNTEGLVAVNTTNGNVTRPPLTMSCGDTPFCLISAGGELVISSLSRTTAYDPADEGRPRASRVGPGWITIPSTEPGRVWLGILARGKLGGPYSRGLGEVREVDLQGNVIRRMEPPSGAWPVGAVTSGLLFQEPDSLRLWEFGERDFTLRIPGEFPADTSGALLASCGEPCPRFLLTDTASGVTTPIAPPPGYRWLGGYGGAFAPDGAHVALPVARSDERSSHAQDLAIVDVSTGKASVMPRSAKLDPVYGAMTWSRDGSRLYFGGPDASIMSYALGASSSPVRLTRLSPKDTILQMVSVAPDAELP